MNGNPVLIGAKPPLTEDQQYCASLLREALSLAEEGKVNSLCMVVCLETGWATVMGGKRAGDLNLGCDDIKAKILTEVTRGNVMRSVAKSNILRVKR